MSDAHERNSDLLEGAIEVEIETRELANAKFIVNLDTRVNFLAAVAVFFEADMRLQQFDLRGNFGSSLRGRFLV